MRRSSAPILVSFCAALVSFAPVPPPTAAAAPLALKAAAASAVLAARGPAGVRTAFAFERKGLLITAGGNGVVRVIAGTGATASAAPARRQGRLAALEISGLGLTPLVAVHRRELPAGARAYVLGPPLGYETAHLRSVLLPRMRLAATRSIQVRGTLPASFAGAPVVTPGGAVIGAVASVAAGRWRLAPRGALLALAGSHAAAAGGGGSPILSFAIGGLLIFAAGTAFGVMRAKRRRQLALESRMRSARMAAAANGEQQPLVRLRGSSSAAADEQGAEGEQDFEVIVKSREQK